MAFKNIETRQSRGEKRSRYVLLCATALVALLPTGSARAQAAPSDGGGVVKLDTIEVQGERSPEPVSGRGGPPLPGGFQASRPSSGILGNKGILQTPLSVQGFTEKLIRDQQAQVATDVLKNDPSVTIQNNLGYFADSFLIRGFSPGLSNILYDGMTVGLLGKYQLEGVERLDIIKGPAAVLFGVGGFQGIGGLINYVPKRPLPFDYTSIGAAFTAPGYGVGTVDVSRRYGEHGEWGVRFNGAVGRGTFWSDTHLTHDVAQLTLDGKVSQTVRLYADLIYWNNSNDRDQLPFALAAGVPVPRAPNPKVNYQQKFNYTYNPGLLGVIKAEVDISNDWMLSVGGRASRYVNDFLALVPTITGTNGNYTLAASGARPTTYNDFGGQATVNGKVQTGAIKHEIAFGVDVQSDVGYLPPSVPLGSYASNLYAPRYYPAPFQPSSISRRASDTLSTTGFFSDLVTLPGEYVQFLGAVRYVNIDFESRDRTTSIVNGRSDTGKALPIGAVLLHPTQNMLIYASYAQGFERGGIAPIAAANALAALSPISSEQVEVGAKATFSVFTASFAAFRIDRALEYTDPVSNLYVQNGRQVHDGLEFALSGEVSEGVRLLGGVTLLDPKAEQTGNPLTSGHDPIGVPRLQASLYGEYDLPWVKGLTGTGGVYYVDKEYYDLTNSRYIKPSTRVDLGMRYDTVIGNYRTTLRLGVENVADRTYWAAATTSGLALAAPRTIKGSVQVRW